MTEKSSLPSKSNWRKSPAELVLFFKNLMSDQSGIELRSMFGYPCAFINSQMFTGLFADSMIIRLPETERKQFQTLDGASPFEPFPGRPMKEYSVIPGKMIESPDELKTWLAISMDYAASLPEKVKKLSKKK